MAQTLYKIVTGKNGGSGSFLCPPGYAPNTPEARVWAQAQENGRAAASWVIDGNTSMVSVRGLLKGIEDGDPMVLDAIRVPSLSGEYSDDYSEDQLMADVGWVPHDGTDMRDELAAQYNTEVETAFWGEVERSCRKALGLPESTELDVELASEPCPVNVLPGHDYKISGPDGYPVGWVVVDDENGGEHEAYDAEGNFISASPEFTLAPFQPAGQWQVNTYPEAVAAAQRLADTAAGAVSTGALDDALAGAEGVARELTGGAGRGSARSAPPARG